MNKIFLTFSLLFLFTLNSQVNVDSLKLVWNDNSNADSTRKDALRSLIWNEYLNTQVDSAIKYAILMRDFSDEKNQKQWLADSYNSLGSAYRIKGEYLLAIDYLEKCIDLNKELGNQLGEASALGNLGILYMGQAEYGPALKNFIYCKKVFEKMGNMNGALNAMNYIGGVYIYQKEYDKADQTYREALMISREENNKMMEAYLIGNIGLLKESMGQLDSALFYFFKGIRMDRSIKNTHGEMTTNLNIASVYLTMGNLESAEKYYRMCLQHYQNLGEKKGVSMVLNSLSEIDFQKGNMTKALKKAKESYQLAIEVGDVTQLKSISEHLYKIHKKLGNAGEALKMHELYLDMKDSLRSEEDKKQVLQQSFQYKYDRKVMADSLEQIEKDKIADLALEVEKEKTQKEKQKQLFLWGGLILLALVGGYIYSRLKVISNQKKIIEDQQAIVESKRAEAELQKEIVEAKNQEILDSINYAKKLQSAILPSDEKIEKLFQDYFLFYQPKDIVAGDFYWMEKVKEYSFVAVADCTGHGVPGALVSVVCSNALTKAIIEEGILDPGAILDRTRELVIEKFSSNEGIRDGMDISLARINMQTNEMQWSGANNNLWIVRDKKNASDSLESERIREEDFEVYEKRLIELKSQKQPIGNHTNSVAFETVKVDLEKGDLLYFYSDGIADQFGGNNMEGSKKAGKKLKTKNLKSWVAKFSNYELGKQGDLLADNFEKWKGDLEQLDDVCMFGLRI